jgi:hypothetical protein
LSLLDNNWGLAVFTISRNLKTLAKCHTVYIDGTFRTSPAPYFQFVTIHGYFRDRVIPLVFCLLNGKQVGQYRKILRHIKRKTLRVSGQPFDPQKLVCDFEAAIIAAIQMELPNTRVQGCYFHLCQSLWRKVQEIGLAGPYRTKAKLRKCLQKFMAIGYLPLALVRQNFHTYVGSGLVTRCLQRYPQLQRFIQYMDANYVSANALFPPKIWNVFQRTSDTRTNNFVEGKLALIFKVALAYFLQKSYFIRHVFSCYYLKIEPTCAFTYYAC